MYWRLSWQNSFGQFLPNSALIGFSMNSRNAVMREVLMFPADCSRRTGIFPWYQRSTNSLELACVSWKRVSVRWCKIFCWCTIDLCTAEKTSEVEFRDVNHCVTIEDNFGFVTKDFVKPTAEGMQFTNGNSHHPRTTFKSILFGEAIRLRRLNQRNDDYLISLNRLKEKAVRSKFPLNMTNDMIALASNW